MIQGNFATREVTINGKPVSPERSQALVNHSPDGFSWGYGGSGPAQLALSILHEFGLPAKAALDHYQQFKWDTIARLPQADFILQEEDIRGWIKQSVRNPETNSSG